MQLESKLRDSVGKRQPIANPFDGFVFVCGGPLPDGYQTHQSLSSARHFALLKAAAASGFIAGRRIIVAEHVTDLLTEGLFDNLLEFERYLAALAACIVIFLESPGSIAELGCFSVLSEASSKLLVVGEQRYHQPPESFIDKGPVAHLRKQNRESVRIFPYHKQEKGQLIPCSTLLEECWEDVYRAIEGALSRPVPEQEFQATSIAHQLVLAAELTSMFLALRITELRNCLNFCGVSLTPKAMKRSVKLLVKFGLLEYLRWDNETFYAAPDAPPRIAFRSDRITPPFDKARFQFECIELYKHSDYKKYKAIRSRIRNRAGTK